MEDLLTPTEKGRLAGGASVILFMVGAVFWALLVGASRSPLSTPLDPILAYAFTHGLATWAFSVVGMASCIGLFVYYRYQFGDIQIVDSEDASVQSWLFNWSGART